MCWNHASNIRIEMPLSPTNHNISTDATESVNPGTSVHVPSTCCTPPPSYHNINLPLGHHSTLPSDRGAPPSYEEAIDPNAPPPSYDSLFGRMREAHKVSKGVFDFLKNIIVLLVGTIGCTIILGVTIVVPICMMIIGALYLYDCPQGEYIPVYLLVGGGFGVFKQLLHLSARVRQRQEERDEERIRQSPTQTLINCFMLGWFIIGSMWVYKEYEPNYDPNLGKHCNKTLYLFAFWLITSVYICLGVITAGLCSISVASIAFQRPPPDLIKKMRVYAGRHLLTEVTRYRGTKNSSTFMYLRYLNDNLCTDYLRVRNTTEYLHFSDYKLEVGYEKVLNVINTLIINSHIRTPNLPVADWFTREKGNALVTLGCGYFVVNTDLNLVPRESKVVREKYFVYCSIEYREKR